MKELLWDLFKITGKIEYYLRYKELEYNDNKSKRTNRKGN